MIKIIREDVKEFCNVLFKIRKGVTEDITLVDLERQYREYYSEDNAIIS